MQSKQRIALLAALVATGIPSLTHADISISGKPTANMSCDSGVCTATAQKAVLNVGDLQTMLASGDVAVNTGSVAKDINIDQPLTWATVSRLMLDAQQSVTVNKQVVVSGTGNLTIVTNDGGKKGEFVIAPKASVQFWDTASSLIIDGNSYTLVGDIKTLAADIAANPSGFYALAQTYDASGDGPYPSSPVTTVFPGTLEGLGNALLNIEVGVTADQTEVGLFANIDVSGAVRNILLKNIVIGIVPSATVYVGILAGENHGRISRAIVSGTITNQALYTYIGGVTGRDYGIVEGSQSNVHITTRAGANIVGGLVGIVGATQGQPLAEVIGSSASGAIDASDGNTAGGLVGVDGLSEIAYSRASGRVTAGNLSWAGGLIGASGSITHDNFATGDVRVGNGDSGEICGARAGGLVGESGGSVANSFGTGNVTAGTSSCVGGIFGTFAVGYENEQATAMTSYSTGHVAGGASAFVAGLIGDEKHRYRSSIRKTYWDVTSSGSIEEPGNGVDSRGATGLTTEEFRSGLPDGFDPNIWGQSPNINTGYPYLLANPPQ